MWAVGPVGARQALDLHRRAVGDDLGDQVGDLVGVEAHRDNGVCAPVSGRLLESLDRVVAAVGQQLRVALSLAADDRAQARADVSGGLAPPRPEAEDLAVNRRY